MKNMSSNKRAIRWMFLLLGLTTFSMYAQTSSNEQRLTISGTVTDATTGEPLPGINVDVEGYSSAITEDNGQYKLRVPDYSVLLKVSGYGYATRDVSVKGRSKVDITLYGEGYKGSRKDVYMPTGNVSSTKLANSVSQIAENNTLSVALSPDGLMQSFASGMQVSMKSGMPGAGSTMSLHGLTTMNAGSTPLFIVDGLPYENTSYATSLIGNYSTNPLASIDVKDIESITVLKDGTSLYGVKGANGVVLIKTLRANQLETKINVHLHTGFNLQAETLPVLNAAQHKNLLSDLYQSQGLSSSLVEQLPIFNNEVPVAQPWGYEGNVDYYRYNHETDWQDFIYDNKWNQNFYLNVAGGDEIAKYVLSLGYLNQEGSLKNTHFQRFSTRFNSEIKLSQKVNFYSNMSFVYGNKELMNEGPDSQLNPILASLVKSPFTTSHIYNEEGKLSPNEEGVDYFGNSNPYVLSNNLLLANINYRFVGTFELNWNVNKHLGVSGSVGLNFNKERERVFYPSVGVAFNPIGETVVTNEMQHRTDRLFSLFTDFHADYNKSYTTDHVIQARAGVRYQNNKAQDDFGKAYNSSSDDFKTIGYGIPLLRQIGGSIGNWNWLSLYATANYTLQNKYIFNVSIASDASSRYGTDAASFYTYPSVAGAWLLSGEDFLKDVDAIDLLKLRLSYGLSGNDDIGNYNGIQYYKPQNLLGSYGLIRGNLVNKGLKPETITRKNLGLDLSVLDERVNVSLDFYSNTIQDMILVTTPSRLTGFDRYITNAGSMRNNGTDLSVDARILKGDLTWDLGVNVSTYKNKVLDLNGEEFLTNIAGATIQTKVGQPLGVFYGYKTDGVYATQADAANDGLNVLQGLVAVPFSAGDMRFVNQNSDNLIDDNDRVVIGDPNPDFFGSLNNTFKYDKWSVNALMIYSIGNDVFNYTRSRLENLSTFDNQSQATLNRWRKEGDDFSIPRAVYGDAMGNARFSDRWIEDGSYLRLKSLTLAYDLELPGSFIQSCTLFATGENLLTLTKYKGLDPEFSYGSNTLSRGIDPCVVPMPKTISIGVKMTL